MAVRKIVLVVEYDGSDYSGFQLQVGQPTVQGALEAALYRLTGEKRRVMAASRTDAGVHAEEQVVSFRTEAAVPLTAFVGGLNHYLAEDIAVKAAYPVAEGFNVRRDAVSREYEYWIDNSPTRAPLRRGRYYRVSGDLDEAMMDAASQLLPGKQDFASFVPESELALRSPVKEVYRAGVKREGVVVTFSMVADSFLRHQIRNIVGSLLKVGQHRMTVGEFGDILEARSPGKGGPRAPACGLRLRRVNYAVPLPELSEETGHEDL
ncbi:MAG: tRNA pseudouridine(38-40) synthase TruA [Chloroflexota bacterium]